MRAKRCAGSEEPRRGDILLRWVYMMVAFCAGAVWAVWANWDSHASPRFVAASLLVAMESRRSSSSSIQLHADPERRKTASRAGSLGGDACIPLSRASTSPLCRVCYAPGDGGRGGLLVQPCACRSHVHFRCQQSWQQHKREEGRDALTCEVCKQRYWRSPGAPDEQESEEQEPDEGEEGRPGGARADVLEHWLRAWRQQPVKMAAG